jgi:hypothetical protein
MSDRCVRARRIASGRRSAALLILLLPAIWCCREVAVRTYTDTVYPPTQEIQVFRTAVPTRPYVELAELRTIAGDQRAIDALVQKAKELGADGLVILGEQAGDTVAVPVGGMWMAATDSFLVAVAIRFSD